MKNWHCSSLFKHDFAVTARFSTENNKINLGQHNRYFLKVKSVITNYTQGEKVRHREKKKVTKLGWHSSWRNMTHWEKSINVSLPCFQNAVLSELLNIFLKILFDSNHYKLLWLEAFCCKNSIVTLFLTAPLNLCPIYHKFMSIRHTIRAHAQEVWGKLDKN